MVEVLNAFRASSGGQDAAAHWANAASDEAGGVASSAAEEPISDEGGGRTHRARFAQTSLVLEATLREEGEDGEYFVVKESPRSKEPMHKASEEREGEREDSRRSNLLVCEEKGRCERWRSDPHQTRDEHAAKTAGKAGAEEGEEHIRAVAREWGTKKARKVAREVAVTIGASEGPGTEASRVSRGAWRKGCRQLLLAPAISRHRESHSNRHCALRSHRICDPWRRAPVGAPVQ